MQSPCFLTYFLIASMASTTSDISLLEQANGNKLAPKKEKPNGSIKLKKAIVKKSESKEGEGSGMLRLRNPFSCIRKTA